MFFLFCFIICQILKDVKQFERDTNHMAIKRMCEHASRWLVFSSFFLVLVSVTMPLLAFDISRTVNGEIAVIFVIFFSRWGIAFTQVQLSTRLLFD
jgi:hypothetical protein